MLESIFFLIGSIYLSQFFLFIVDFIISQTGTLETSKLKGSWAVITACTDGIGLGFSTELARQGINIVQVGRNPSKLSSVAADLQSKYGIQVKSIVKDFSHSAEDPIPFFTDIFNQCKNLDISFLINNVGCGDGKLLSDKSFNEIVYHNALNIWPIVFLTQLFLRKLESRKGPAFIINLSSVTATCPIVKGVIYSASKSFDKVISLVTREESRVKILCLQPAFVSTAMTEKFKFKPGEITRDECAKGALRGLERARYTYGHWIHWICYVALYLGSDLSGLIAGYIV